MVNLLCVYENSSSTISLLKDTLNKAFSETNIICTFVSIKCIQNKYINESDIIMLIRPNNFLSKIIARNARKSGRLVIFFIDDDLFNLPMELPSIPWRTYNLWQTLEESDLILSTSPYLLNKYKEHTRLKRNALIDTIVTYDEITSNFNSEKQTKHGEIKIVYAAGKNHSTLFNKYLLPVVPRLIDKYGEKISLAFVGNKPNVSQFESKISVNYYENMSLENYRNFMKEQHFDIGVAPLDNNEFSKGKYYNKFIEYSIVGVVGVYTNSEPYTHVIIDRENGFLTNNDEESWFSTLSLAIDNHNLRLKCLKNAQEQLVNKFSAFSIRERIISQIPELKNKNVDKCSFKISFIHKIIYYISRFADVVYLIGFYLKHEGLKKVINRIKNKL